MNCYELFNTVTLKSLQKSKVGWIALGTGGSVWLLRLTYKPVSSGQGRLGLKAVDKHTVIETGHTGNISDILLVTPAKMVITSGEDSKIKFWSFQASDDPYGMRTLRITIFLQGDGGAVLGDGRYPVNCLGVNSSSLLAVGDCGGGLRVYHVQSASKVVLVTSIDLASIFAKQVQTDEVSWSRSWRS